MIQSLYYRLWYYLFFILCKVVNPMLLIQGLIYSGNLTKIEIALSIIDKLYPCKKNIKTTINQKYRTAHTLSSEYYPWHIATIKLTSETPKIIKLLIKYHFPFYTAEYGQFSNIFTILFTADLTNKKNLLIVNESLKLILHTNSFENDFQYKSSNQLKQSNNCVYELVRNPFLYTNWWEDIHQDTDKKEFIILLCKHFDLISISANWQGNFISEFLIYLITPKLEDAITYIIFNLYLEGKINYNGILNEEVLNIGSYPYLAFLYLEKARNKLLSHYEQQKILQDNLSIKHSHPTQKPTIKKI